MPNRLQSLLTFDTRIDTLDALVRDFARVEEMKTSTIFNVSQHKPDLFAQLENADEGLQLTFEFCLGPPSKDALKQVLASPITTQLCPDIAGRVGRAACHVLLEARHEDTQELDENGMPSAASPQPSEQSEQSAFRRRLDLLTLMSRIPFDHTPPSAVHWAQSNRLFAGEDFDAAASKPVPGPLHIHPCLLGPKRQALDPAPDTRGVRSFGAEHWIGGEIVIEPGTQDWRSSYDAILAFVTASTAGVSGRFADDDVFEAEGMTQRYRVKTKQPANSGAGEPGALFELVPLDPVTPAPADADLAEQNQDTENLAAPGLSRQTYEPPGQTPAQTPAQPPAERMAQLRAQPPAAATSISRPVNAGLHPRSRPVFGRKQI